MFTKSHSHHTEYENITFNNNCLNMDLVSLDVIVIFIGKYCGCSVSLLWCTAARIQPLDFSTASNSPQM